jgi:hypothetical protein
MSHQSNRSFLHNQLQDIQNLQQLAGDHPVMGPSLQARRHEVEDALKALPAVVKEPRVVLFFSGRPVAGAQGIDASFATGVINQFLEMVKTEYSVLRHGTVGSRGPRRGEAEAKLLLSGLPRGSFGLELSRPPTDELLPDESLSNTLIHLTELIQSAAQSDDVFAGAFSKTTPRLLHRLRDFLNVVAEGDASLRVVTGDVECSLDKGSVSKAAERVNSTETTERSVSIVGTFRGALLDSWRFDFRSSDGRVIEGRIAEDLQESDVVGMLGLTNKECRATLKEISVSAHKETLRVAYELERLEPSEAADQKPSG